jgi:hypothetical protein
MSSAEHHQNWMQQISSTLKLPLEQIKLAELQELYRIVQVASETGSLSVNDQSTFKQLRDKYFGQNAFATNFRRSSERLGEVQGLVRGLSNEYILMTYGTALPSYLDALQFYKEDSKPKRQHRALLVGAAGSSSVKEFVWGVNHVFPGASCSIIDIEGAETPAAAQQYGANFIYGDGFQMPFSNAFDTIHVNRLFGYLEEDLPRDPAVNRFSHVDNFSSVRQTFFSSVYDSLIPGGMMLMADSGVSTHYRNYQRRLRTELAASGFEYVSTDNSIQFTKKADLDSFLAGNTTSVDYTRLAEMEKVLFITARKPDASSETTILL